MLKIFDAEISKRCMSKSAGYGCATAHDYFIVTKNFEFFIDEV